jgi:hypothetical protein
MALIRQPERERGRFPIRVRQRRAAGRGPADWNRTGRLIPAVPRGSPLDGLSPFVIDEPCPTSAGNLDGP